MRCDLRTIDAGVRAAVAALNQIPGVATHRSCEGAGSPSARHRHADLAYVTFYRPLPLRLQAFLVMRLDALARIEDDGIYSRWPAKNRQFLDALVTACHAFTRHQQEQPFRQAHWTLPKLRALIARVLSYRRETMVALCLDCADIIIEAHQRPHRLLPLLRLAANQEALWFAEFVRERGNALDATLIAADGWDRLLERSQRGSFGGSFHRRWLRYRTARITELSTQHIRMEVQRARRRGSDLDFFYDDRQAVFAWTQ